MQIKFIILSLVFFSACSSPTSNLPKEQSENNRNINSILNENSKFRLQIGKNNLFQDSLIQQSHFRGLFIKNNIAYMAGTNNLTPEVNLETGEIYSFDYIETPSQMEFRDIHRSNNHSLNMSIIHPSGIFTQFSDASRNTGISPPDTLGFKTHYINTDTLCFLDGMDFWNDSVGLVFGDPLDGYPFVLKTKDGGGTWNRIEQDNLPTSLKMEAGFAASGTSIVCVGDGIGYIGLGGEQARIFKTTDYGNSWKAINTCMLQGEAGKGIYSMAFKDELNGVAVGGNWENTSCTDSKIYTSDGGLTWQKGTGIQEYRSCVTHWKDDIYISTGTSGTDISYDNGATWSLMDTLGFNSIAFMDNGTGIGVGNRGLIRKLELQIIND